MMKWSGILLAAGLAASVAPAYAQNLLDPNPIADVVSEVRLGGHIHDIYWTFIPQKPQEWKWDGPTDVSFDVLFHSPDMDAFRWLGSPRPEIGVTLNTRGLESLVHLGLTWQLPIFETPFYLEGSLGGAIHNGELSNAPAPYRNMGCRVNFYERFGVGANVSENLTATLTYEHTSNADLCESNAGLSNFGIRLGWKF
jgi:lipid A 3-O-deacylase